MADIAVLRFRQADYAAAAPSFQQIAQFYGNNHWAILEGSMLELYARCLKELQRNDEYIRALLRLLSRYAKHIQGNFVGSERKICALPSVAEHSPQSSYVDELLRASQAFQKEFSVPLPDFFGEFQVLPEILHYENKDGFQLQLCLRSLLAVNITINSIKVRLVNSNGLQNNEVWLESSEKFIIKPSLTKLLIGSTVSHVYEPIIFLPFLTLNR
jgi:trafficking protein particle complex subunit 10